MWRQHFFSRGRPLVLSSPQSPGADMSPKKLSYPGAYNYINEERRERVRGGRGTEREKGVCERRESEERARVQGESREYAREGGERKEKEKEQEKQQETRKKEPKEDR